MEDITLALSFNTRKIGLAVFKSNILMDYFMKHHKSVWSPQKRDQILTSLQSCCQHYNITNIVLSIDAKHYQTKEWMQVLSSLVSFANLKGIAYTTYPTHTIYSYYGCHLKRKRDAFMKRLCILLPELKLYYDKEMRNRHKYYIKLFEAIGTGAYHLSHVNK
jgi:hypothetical protein